MPRSGARGSSECRGPCASRSRIQASSSDARRGFRGEADCRARGATRPDAPSRASPRSCSLRTTASTRQALLTGRSARGSAPAFCRPTTRIVRPWSSLAGGRFASAKPTTHSARTSTPLRRVKTLRAAELAWIPDLVVSSPTGPSPRALTDRISPGDAEGADGASVGIVFGRERDAFGEDRGGSTVHVARAVGVTVQLCSRVATDI